MSRLRRNVWVCLNQFTHTFHLARTVLRCKDLSRTNGGPINAYVKVALLSTAQTSDTGFQRTAVQRNSAEPIFEHRFAFDNAASSQPAERVQLSVWHRDREYK